MLTEETVTRLTIQYAATCAQLLKQSNECRADYRMFEKLPRKTAVKKRHT